MESGVILPTNPTPERDMSYESFLICFHEQHTDVYRNGLPIGIIRNGVFEVHEHTMPDGSKHPVKIDPVLAERVRVVTELLTPCTT